MSKKVDFYEILGIAKDASSDEIKKAYRKLAIRWHPDKNPGKEKESEEMFKQIAEAYAVLSDPNKRNMYDRYGTADPQQAPGNGRPSDFGFDFDFGGFGSRGGRSGDFFGDTFGGHFSFERAEELFRDVFSNEPGFSGSNSRNKNKENQKQSHRRAGDFAQDGFGMGGGMGGFGNMDRFMNNFGFGGFGGSGRGGFGDDDFFGDSGFGGFGGMGGMGGMNMQTSFSSMSGGFGGGVGKSVSTSTIIKNGKQVTVTQTTIRNPDGTTRTEVQESVAQDGKNLSSNRYISSGQVGGGDSGKSRKALGGKSGK